MTDDVLEHLADVLRADVCRVGLRERLSPPRFELRPSAHRVLELRAVRLDAKRHAGRRADRPAHQHVVREDHVSGQELAQRSGVRLDVRAFLVVGEVLDELRVQPGVAIHDKHGQQPAREIHGDGLRASQVVQLGLPLLRHDDDVVTGVAPLARERTGVDVRPGACEQVAVPEEDAHEAERYVRWKYSACSNSTAGFDVCTVTSDGTSSSASE